MAQLDLPLPEITVSDFERSWTRFELVASAKEWNDTKKKLILPTLLRGKLVDVYIALDEETRGDLPNTKTALMQSAGVLRDPLTAGQAFMSRRQGTGETVRDYAMHLKKLFVESYPGEAQTSVILLQRFLTGLSPSICRQLLLKGKPTSLAYAITDATGIEYALNFEPAQESCEINVVKPGTAGNDESKKLQSVIEQMAKKLEVLEMKLESATIPSKRIAPQPTRRRPPPNNDVRTCWRCGEIGHLRRQCPLNDNRPVRPVGGWPRS